MPKGKKYGGRVKGTPNKDNPLKGFLRDHSTAYFTEPVADDPQHRTQFQLDTLELAPDDRVTAELKLLEFHQAKLKAVDANVSTHNVVLTIEDRLEALCEEDDEADDEDEEDADEAADEYCDN